MNFKNIINLLFFIVFTLIPNRYVFSADYAANGSIDFGIIMQNSLPSVIPVTAEGQRDEAGTQGVYKAQDPTVSNIINFTTTGNWVVGEKIKIATNQQTEILDIDGCSHQFSNITTSNNEFAMTSSSYNLPFSLTLSLNNYCPSDKTYSGTFTVQYQTADCFLTIFCGSYGDPQYVPFHYSFKIEDPLGADEIQPLNFGTIMPILDGTGTVTIAPEDEAITVTGDIKYFYSGYSRGIYQIYGIGNRMVNITMPSSVNIYNITENNGDTMVVDNFKVSSTFAYTQTADGAKVEIPLNDVSFDSFSNFFVGATLHVGSGVSAGTYRGEYTILLSY